MKIERDSLGPIDFEGLEIRDYTAGADVSSSVAEITVPAGARHRLAWSKRSDKYYYVLEGRLSFTLGAETLDLAVGDCCIVRKGERSAIATRRRACQGAPRAHTELRPGRRGP